MLTIDIEDWSVVVVFVLFFFCFLWNLFWLNSLIIKMELISMLSTTVGTEIQNERPLFVLQLDGLNRIFLFFECKQGQILIAYIVVGK